MASLHDAPIVSSYNDRIRPLLDTVDKLKIEGIQLPTIVVVGDQSSGKSSVLESLTGISLHRGQGICTRVPLIMRLQNHRSTQPELFLEYERSVVQTDEEHIADAIILATEEIAGKGKGISNNPLTLTIKKNGVPDLNMVDLPGITRVPVPGRPEDICEQVSKMINEYITREESIILNVLSASVDLSTCESIRMSRRVDRTGKRTLVVVTKADKSPEDLLEKVTIDYVNMGFEYVCVRNRLGDESYEEARAEEARLFETHPQLSKIDKSIVGVPVLAESLMKIQASIIVKRLPEIVGKINSKLSENMEALKATFMHILFRTKDSLKKILLQGEFDEYPDATDMHCTVRMAEMLDKYYEELQSAKADPEKKFLVEEITFLEESKEIRLPNFLPKAAFHNLLQKNLRAISTIPFDCIEKLWSYMENVVISVLLLDSDNCPQLSSPIRKAVQNLFAKKKQKSVYWVKDMIEMEKLSEYTCNRGYVASWNKLMSSKPDFMKYLEGKSRMVTIFGFGSIDASHLRGQNHNLVKEAFDLKMMMTTYWEIVSTRLVDNMALHLRFSTQNLVNNELQGEIISELIGSDGDNRRLKRMLGNTLSISGKRKKVV